MNSLKKQIIYCVLGSLIPIAILGTGDFAADIIIPAILIVAHGPLLVFYVVFNAMKSGKGSEFKEERVIIAALLWVGYLLVGMILGFSILSYLKIGTPVFIMLLLHVMAIAAVVVLSYKIGKHRFELKQKKTTEQEPGQDFAAQPLKSGGAMSDLKKQSLSFLEYSFGFIFVMAVSSYFLLELMSAVIPGSGEAGVMILFIMILPLLILGHLFIFHYVFLKKDNRKTDARKDR